MIKNRLMIILMSSCLMLSSKARAIVPMATITAQELKTLMESTPNYADPEQSPFIIVNTLGKQYFDDCHIPGSVNAPLYVHYSDDQKRLYQIIFDWDVKGWLTTKEFIVYCALDRCDASAQAYLMLKGAGARVRAYEGGIREWLQLGYPVEGPCVQEYLRTVSNSSLQKALPVECSPSEKI